jgi:hypothetical protein
VATSFSPDETIHPATWTLRVASVFVRASLMIVVRLSDASASLPFGLPEARPVIPQASAIVARARMAQWPFLDNGFLPDPGMGHEGTI